MVAKVDPHRVYTYMHTCAKKGVVYTEVTPEAFYLVDNLTLMVRIPIGTADDALLHSFCAPFSTTGGFGRARYESGTLERSSLALEEYWVKFLFIGDDDWTEIKPTHFLNDGGDVLIRAFQDVSKPGRYTWVKATQIGAVVPHAKHLYAWTFHQQVTMNTLGYETIRIIGTAGECAYMMPVRLDCHSSILHTQLPLLFASIYVE